MSLQDALRFIQKVEAEADLRDAMRALGDDLDVRKLVAMGSRSGLDFTVDELNSAFALDWAMRRAHFTGVFETASD